MSNSLRRRAVVALTFVALAEVAAATEGFQAAAEPSAVGFLTAVRSGAVVGLGTGFRRCDGIVVTALHSVKTDCASGRCTLAFEADPRYECGESFALAGSAAAPSDFTLAAADQERDVALLWPTTPLDGPCVSVFRAPVVGEPTRIVGFPYRVHRPNAGAFSPVVERLASEGTVSASSHIQHPLDVITDADALPGSSGAPVFGEDGAVIGMVVEIYQPDGVPAAGPQGFEVIPYGGVTLFVPGDHLAP